MSRQRKLKGTTVQRNVTFPTHIWELIDRIADLQSAAYKEMGGKSRYFPSDLFEAGFEMYLESFIEDHGQLPEGVEATRQFVKRLAEANKKSLMEQLLHKKR